MKFNEENATVAQWQSTTLVRWWSRVRSSPVAPKRKTYLTQVFYFLVIFWRGVCVSKSFWNLFQNIEHQFARRLPKSYWLILASSSIKERLTYWVGLLFIYSKFQVLLRARQNQYCLCKQHQTRLRNKVCFLRYFLPKIQF